MSKEIDQLRKRLERVTREVAESEAHLALATKELKEFFGTTNPKQVKAKVKELERAAAVAEQQWEKARKEFEARWEEHLNEE